jgi:hypothetical protein
VKVLGQLRAKEKGTSGAKKAIALLTIVVLGLVAGIFFGGFYLVHELVLFVCIAALLALFSANLLVLGILLHAAGQGILQSLRKSKPTIAAYEVAKSEHEDGSLVDSPTIGRAAGANSR